MPRLPSQQLCSWTQVAVNTHFKNKQGISYGSVFLDIFWIYPKYLRILLQNDVASKVYSILDSIAS